MEVFPWNDLVMFLSSWLLQYIDLVDYLGIEGKTVSMPTMIVKDFNLSEDDREKT